MALSRRSSGPLWHPADVDERCFSNVPGVRKPLYYASLTFLANAIPTNGMSLSGISPGTAWPRVRLRDAPLKEIPPTSGPPDTTRLVREQIDEQQVAHVDDDRIVSARRIVRVRRVRPDRDDRAVIGLERRLRELR